MREIRMFVAVLLMSILIVPFIGCSKTKDEEQQTSTAAAESTTPAEHEVVSTVYEFLKAIDGGDYDHAIELGTPNEFKREGLIKFNEIFELDQAKVLEAYVGNKQAAVLTSTIPAQAPARTGQFGYSLLRNEDGWLIRDSDFLPNNEAVEKWLSGFRSVEPDAERVAVAD
jgi:hypothetical protein